MSYNAGPALGAIEVAKELVTSAKMQLDYVFSHLDK